MTLCRHLSTLALACMYERTEETRSSGLNVNWIKNGHHDCEEDV